MKTPIQKLLFEKGISQAAVAKALGITDKSASRKLSGQVDLWWSEVVILCRMTGIENPMDILPIKGKENQ